MECGWDQNHRRGPTAVVHPEKQKGDRHCQADLRPFQSAPDYSPTPSTPPLHHSTTPPLHYSSTPTPWKRPRHLPAILLLLSSLLLATSLHAGDAEILAALKAKGGQTTETKGAVNGLNFPDCSNLVVADYAQIGQLTGIKQLGFGKGPTDAGPPEPIGAATARGSALHQRRMDVTDETIATLASWKSLSSFAIFHPGPKFTGKGLAAFASLPKFENLTVAGSTGFGDEGMAAVATLTGLKAFRTWHSGVTTEGVKKFSSLKNLTSLWVGQRLSYTPPVTVSDAVLPVFADLPLLEGLTLDEARLTLPALSQLKKLTHLKRLTLNGIDIPEADINALKQQLPEDRHQMDGAQRGEQEAHRCAFQIISRMNRLLASLAMTLLIYPYSNSTVRAEDAGFSTILDKDHNDGWKYIGDGEMKVESGVATTSAHHDPKSGLYWYQKKSFTDFTLKLEFSVDTETSNSGILVRFPDPGSDYKVAADQGYEVDIYGPKTGTIVFLSSFSPLASGHPEAFHSIRASGMSAK